jgi:small multidrug resistance pump
MVYVYLVIAVAFEVVATTALKESEGFTRLWPSAVTVVGYAVAFYFLALTLRLLPIGIVYAIWSGTGIVFLAAIGWIVYRQSLDAPAVLGLGLIVAGILVINLFSRTVSH